MMDRETLIEQCLLDAEKGYLVDESMMSWLKGKAAAASQAYNNIGTSIKNGAKNVRAGYKNALGKMAGGATHDAAKKEASNIKATRDKYSDVNAASQQAEQKQLDHENKVARAKRIKKAGAAREKAENKAAKTLKKAATKALNAIEEFINAGGVIKHGSTNATKSVIKTLQKAAGINEAPAAQDAAPAQETPAEPTERKRNSYTYTSKQLANARKPKLNKQKPGETPPLRASTRKESTNKKSAGEESGENPYAGARIGGGHVVDKAIENTRYTGEAEETVNRSVTAVHESNKHFNTPAQLKMLNSIR